MSIPYEANGRVNDFFTQIPGLNVSTDGYASSQSTISIRGITTGGFGYPTVGTAIDDVPDHRGAGFIYWYPEAIKLPHLWTWRSGALALFDEHGLPLPSMEAYKKDLPK